MKDPIRKQRAHAVLGLAFDGARLEGVVLRRTNGSAQVTGRVQARLDLDPLGAEPDLAGREIRNHLEKAEIRERRCVVAIPLEWVLTLQTPVPDLPEADVEGLLQIEAERGFPYSPESLMISRSMARLPGGETVAMQVAVLRDNVLRLEKVLRAARLQPVSFTVGLPARQGLRTEGGTALALAVGEGSLELQITAGDGLLALRTLNDSVSGEAGALTIQPDAVARELRIALGQLPAAVRQKAGALRVFGTGPAIDALVAGIGPRLELLGLKAERATQLDPQGLGLKIEGATEPGAALCVAARLLAGRTTGLEFLPPKISAWQQFSARYSTQKLTYTGVVAGGIALLVAVAFGIQQVQLSRLRSEWNRMSPKVRELEGLQGRIRQYRPWFDDSLRTLSILRRLTEAFPEDGVVTAKTVEIRETAPVICSGTARDNQALMKTIDTLRATPEVADVQVDQLRGKSPVQFSFNFQWSGGGSQP